MSELSVTDFDSVMRGIGIKEMCGTMQLSALFTRGDNTGTAKNVLNQMLKSNPEYTETILAVVLYPVLQWSLYGENITNVIQAAVESGEAQQFAATKQMLREAFGFGSRLALERRKAYFEMSRKIVNRIDNILIALTRYPRCGKQLILSLRIVMDAKHAGSDDGDHASKFEIRKYLPQAIEALHLMAGPEFTEMVNTLLAIPEQDEVDNDEELYVYHNIKVLLKEYGCLYWAREDSANAVARILHCTSPEEVLKITGHNGLIYSADIVLQFLLLITGAIALTAYYPVSGEEYARVLKALVANRNGANTPESHVAREQGMSPQRFSAYKQQAFALLGLLLWGYDGQVLLSVLSWETDKSVIEDD